LPARVQPPSSKRCTVPESKVPSFSCNRTYPGSVWLVLPPVSSRQSAVPIACLEVPRARSVPVRYPPSVATTGTEPARSPSSPRQRTPKDFVTERRCRALHDRPSSPFVVGFTCPHVTGSPRRQRSSPGTNVRPFVELSRNGASVEVRGFRVVRRDQRGGRRYMHRVPQGAFFRIAVQQFLLRNGLAGGRRQSWSSAPGQKSTRVTWRGTARTIRFRGPSPSSADEWLTRSPTDRTRLKWTFSVQGPALARARLHRFSSRLRALLSSMHWMRATCRRGTVQRLFEDAGCTPGAWQTIPRLKSRTRQSSVPDRASETWTDPSAVGGAGPPLRPVGAPTCGARPRPILSRCRDLVFLFLFPRAAGLPHHSNREEAARSVLFFFPRCTFGGLVPPT